MDGKSYIEYASECAQIPRSELAELRRKADERDLFILAIKQADSNDPHALTKLQGMAAASDVLEALRSATEAAEEGE